MSTRRTRPHGLWNSPVTADSLALEKRLDGLAWDSDGRTLAWLEGRDGQGVLVVDAGDGHAPREPLRGRSIRGRVGYGGGDFTLDRGEVFYADAEDGRIWRQPLAGGAPEPLTPAFGQAASPSLSPDGRWLAYVHHDPDGADRLALVDRAGRAWPVILAQGRDFYMQPRWSPDGRHLAWICWDHPKMPWESSELFVAELIAADAPAPSPEARSDALGAERIAGASSDAAPPPALPRLGPARHLAGGIDESIFQPEIGADGKTLSFVSDRSGWGEIESVTLDGGGRRAITRAEAEHGRPAWAQDLRSYALAGNMIWGVRGESGFRRLYQIDPETGEGRRVAALSDYTDVTHLQASPDGRHLALIASAEHLPARVLVYDTSDATLRVAARAGGEGLPAAALSRAEPLSWATADDTLAHGLYYPPASSSFVSLGAPPLVVWIHGGPSSQVTAGWNAWAQFLATRGYAVLAVNHRGSTGYGRDYTRALAGRWGLADVEDSISGVRHLAALGKADPERAAIMGGSAGGFTVLQSLIDAPEVFACGIDMFGVSDLGPLARSTHKFEARYLDGLVGPLPEAAATYLERSPARHADRIQCPLAIFQGADDPVVPRAQSDAIAESLARRGLPHLYQIYEGEGHGWRRRETIAHFWQAVDQFLRDHLI